MHAFCYPRRKENGASEFFTQWWNIATVATWIRSVSNSKTYSIYSANLQLLKADTILPMLMQGKTKWSWGKVNLQTLCYDFGSTSLLQCFHPALESSTAIFPAWLRRCYSRKMTLAENRILSPAMEILKQIKTCL